MRLFTLLAALGCVAGRATAQTVPGSAASTAECQTATDSLRHAARSTDTWELLLACPTQAPAAVATALSVARLETDTIYLSALIGLASRIQTPAVLTAALQLNRDKSATREARVASFEILLAQHGPGLSLRPIGLAWTTILNVPRGTARKMSGLTESGYVATATMPADYLVLIAARADSVATDATEAQVLRDLGGCVRAALMGDVPNLVNASAITMTYVCGTKFKIHNAAASWASFTYDVRGTTDRGSVNGAPSVDTFFFTIEMGSTRLYLDGRLIQTVANAHTTCP